MEFVTAQLMQEVSKPKGKEIGGDDAALCQGKTNWVDHLQVGSPGVLQLWQTEPLCTQLLQAKEVGAAQRKPSKGRECHPCKGG